MSDLSKIFWAAYNKADHNKLISEITNEALEAVFASRQPVGQEPVAFANPDDADDVVGLNRLQSIRESNGTPGKVIAAKYTKPLYNAPPLSAQAVDLGQLRSLARSWIVEAGGTVADTKHACADELLALIDSQAVGK